MQLKADYIKTFLLVVFLCAAFAGFTQGKTVYIRLNDTAVIKELNYSKDTIRKFSISRFTNFYKKINFSNTTFSDDGIFSLATFFNNVSFNNAFFFKDTYFTRTTFLKESDFIGATFLGTSSFITTEFSKAEFAYSTFSNSSNFSFAMFLDNADFAGSIFSDNMIFTSCTISNEINFDDVVFTKKCLLNNLKLKPQTEIYFGDTHFPDIINFSGNSRIYNEIDFTTANFTDSSRYDYKADIVKPVLIYLYKTDISKLHLDYIHFKLLLPDSTLNDYSKKIITNDEKEGMYEALLNNFKVHGQEESIKLCDIEYQTFKWNHSWASFLPCLPYYWNHFGYDKQLVFEWTFWFLIGFTIITCILIGYLNTQVYTVENIPPSFKNFGNRLWFSFIYTSTVFFRLTLKIEKINFEKKLGTTYLILMYTIGLICLAYMANFVLQK